jgi:hypothetical protein
MTDINALLQALSAHLLNEALLSRRTVQEQEQLWATFQSMLLQAPLDQLNDKFRRARSVLEEQQWASPGLLVRSQILYSNEC